MIENFRIRVFRAVAQHLNFSRAAEELLLTQPAVTQQIKALEDQFGLPLFDRGGGHIHVLTFEAPHGKIGEAKSIEDASDHGIFATTPWVT